jgi:hypothetical protein
MSPRLRVWEFSYARVPLWPRQEQNVSLRIALCIRVRARRAANANDNARPSSNLGDDPVSGIYVTVCRDPLPPASCPCEGWDASARSAGGSNWQGIPPAAVCVRVYVVSGHAGDQGGLYTGSSLESVGELLDCWGDESGHITWRLSPAEVRTAQRRPALPPRAAPALCPTQPTPLAFALACAPTAAARPSQARPGWLGQHSGPAAPAAAQVRAILQQRVEFARESIMALPL